MDASWSVLLARTATAAAPFALAIAIGAVVLAATGHEPLAVYQLMIEEAFGGERRIAGDSDSRNAAVIDRPRCRGRLSHRDLQCGR